MSDDAEKLIERVTVRIEEKMAAFLDDWARQHELATGAPISRAAAARRLLQEAAGALSQTTTTDTS